jgi:hypothetical protein
MSISSWVGSVWGLRGAEGSVVGQVRAIDGDSLILSVVGLRGEPPAGVEILPPGDPHGRFARIPVDALLAHWDRMCGSLGRLLALSRQDAAC